MPTNIENEALEALTKTGGDARRQVPHTAVDRYGRPLVVISQDDAGIGGGTQYTEDDAAAANPAGNAQILVRQDAPASEVSANGDNIARRGTAYGAAYSQIVDSSGNFVDTFGGGTQYTEGDTDASITGTALLWEDSADTLATVSASNPLPIGDGGGSITIDDGGGTITVDGTVTATIQEPLSIDDNGSTISVDDGGGTLTVDGTVAATQSGTWDVVSNSANIATESTLGSVQTAVELVDDVVYTDDADWTALTSKHALIGGLYQSTPGTITDGDTGPLRVDENGHLITSPHAESIAFADNVSNTQPIWVDKNGNLVPEAAFGYYFDGTTWDRARGDSTNGMLVNLGSNNDIVQATASNLNAQVVGATAHDAADAGNPIKIGSRAHDYDPDAEDEHSDKPTEVGKLDRANIAVNLRGEQIEGVNSLYHLFDGTFPNTGLDGRYDDGTVGASSSTSESVECWNYRMATVGMGIVSTSTPTVIQIIVEVSYDNTNWFAIKNGALSNWVYDDTYLATEQFVALTFEVAARFIRVKVVATGTTAAAYFTVDDSFVYLRN